jgi:hypothetical protein
MLHVRNTVADTELSERSITGALSASMTEYIRAKWTDVLAPNSVLSDNVSVVRGATLRQSSESKVSAIGQASVRWHGVDILRSWDRFCLIQRGRELSAEHVRSLMDWRA